MRGWARRRHAEEPPPGFIGPESMEVLPRRVRSGSTWCETLAATRFPREVRPGWLQPLLSYRGPVDVSLHVEPLAPELAANQLRRQLARLESTRRLDQQKSKLPDPYLEAAIEDATELAGRLARGEDRLFRAGVYVTVRAGSQEELDEEVPKVRSLLGSLLLDVRPVTFRALEGLVTTLPLGLDALRLRRTFDTKALATTFPFASTEMQTSGGILVGRNAKSGSLVFCDRFDSDGGYSQVILARTGGGKSYLAKLTVLRSLYQGVEVFIIDPENEYERLGRAVGGTVIRLGREGERLNPLELWNPGSIEAIGEQARFCHTVVATLLGGLSSEDKTELERAIHAAYERAGIKEWDPLTHARPAPLLADVVSALGDSPTARSLADRLEPFVHGSFKGLLDRPTTVRPTGHLVVFGLRDLPEELRPAGTLLACDAVWRAVRSGGDRPRIVVVDEAWLLLQHERAASFLEFLARSARKYGCGVTTITQQVSDVVATKYGRTLLDNAATRILLRQSAESAQDLVDTLNLSQGECNYLARCETGHGLYCTDEGRVALEVIASPEEHELVHADPPQIAARKAPS